MSLSKHFFSVSIPISILSVRTRPCQLLEQLSEGCKGRERRPSPSPYDGHFSTEKNFAVWSRERGNGEAPADPPPPFRPRRRERESARSSAPSARPRASRGRPCLFLFRAKAGGRATPNGRRNPDGKRHSKKVFPFCHSTKRSAAEKTHFFVFDPFPISSASFLR